MRSKIVYYNQSLKQRASHLRNNPTSSEYILWLQLKAKKLKGLRFIRQKPIDRYIVDFYCPKSRIIIEVDGQSHIDKYQYDIERQFELERLGFRVLRVSEAYIRNNLVGVLDTIVKYVEG